MKKQHLFIAGCLFLSGSLYAQDCKVLLPAIADKYQGDCSKGKASGIGTAEGKDKYTGNFADGLPDGEGVYIWANGTTYTGSFAKGKMEGKGSMAYKKPGKADSVVAGYWKKDEYLGASEKPYTVGLRTKNISRVEVVKEAKALPSDSYIIITTQSTTGGTANMSDSKTVMVKNPTGSGDVPYTTNGGVSAVPEVSNILISQGSFSQKVAISATQKVKTIRLMDVVYPFKARIQMGNQETEVLIAQPGAWKINITMNQ